MTREQAESLYEELGGDLCICQRADVPHWCERCQQRIGLLSAFARLQTPAGHGPSIESKALAALEHWTQTIHRTHKGKSLLQAGHELADALRALVEVP